MKAMINLYSTISGEIKKFLNDFYSEKDNIEIPKDLFWETEYDNPMDIIELVTCLIDNNDKFKINPWISLDNGVFINVTEDNLDSIIKYIYDRFPIL